MYIIYVYIFLHVPLNNKANYVCIDWFIVGTFNQTNDLIERNSDAVTLYLNMLIYIYIYLSTWYIYIYIYKLWEIVEMKISVDSRGLGQVWKMLERSFRIVKESLIGISRNFYFIYSQLIVGHEFIMWWWCSLSKSRE